MIAHQLSTKGGQESDQMVSLVLWDINPRNDKNAPASVVPGATWPALVVVTEGVESGSHFLPK